MSPRTPADAAVLDRDLAQRLCGADLAGAAGGGDDRELGDADAHPERGDQRDPRMPGLEAGRDVAVAARAGRRARWRAGARPAGRARSPRARRTAPRSRSGGGPGAAWRRARAAPRSPCAAGRSRARTSRRPRTAPRSRRCRPWCRRSRPSTHGRTPAGRRRRRRPRGRGRARRGPAAPSPASEAPGLAMIADRVDAAGRAGERVGGRGREEHRGLAAVAVGGAAGDAGDAVGALAARGGDVEAWRRAAACRRESTTTSRGPEGAWPEVRR